MQKQCQGAKAASPESVTAIGPAAVRACLRGAARLSPWLHKGPPWPPPGPVATATAHCVRGQPALHDAGRLQGPRRALTCIHSLASGRGGCKKSRTHSPREPAVRAGHDHWRLRDSVPHATPLWHRGVAPALLPRARAAHTGSARMIVDLLEIPVQQVLASGVASTAAAGHLCELKKLFF